jgi:c-di-GMP-binding flagellar brake protein YcgR
MHTRERRKHPRFSITLPVEVHTEGGHAAFRCITSDLSLGGCYIETLEPFPVGTTLDLKLRIEDTLHIQAKVITAYPQVGNGMQFIRILPEDHDLLNAFLDAIAKKQELAEAAGK